MLSCRLNWQSFVPSEHFPSRLRLATANVANDCRRKKKAPRGALYFDQLPTSLLGVRIGFSPLAGFGPAAPGAKRTSEVRPRPGGSLSLLRWHTCPLTSFCEHRQVQSWMTKPSPALLGRPCPSINTTQRTAIQFALSTKVPCAFFSRHARVLYLGRGINVQRKATRQVRVCSAHANVRTCAPTPASDHGEIKLPILNIVCRR